MSSVSFRKLEKNYGSLRIVKGIDLEIADREFVVLVGPSPVRLAPMSLMMTLAPANAM